MTVEVKEASKLEVGVNYNLKAVIYGRSGSGKTYSLRTLPKPIGVVDTDKGMLSLRGVEGVKYVEIDYDSDRIDPKAWIEIKEAFTAFSRDQEIRTIVGDSITTISDAALKSVLFLNKHMNQAATLPDYMLQIKRLEDLFTSAITAKKHLVFTAHEEFEKNEMTGQVWCLPMIVGKLSSKLPIWFDEVYHTIVKKGDKGQFEYLWVTRSDVMYSCKSRLASTKPDVSAEVVQDFVAYAKMCGVELK